MRVSPGAIITNRSCPKPVIPAVRLSAVKRGMMHTSIADSLFLRNHYTIKRGLFRIQCLFNILGGREHYGML